VDIQLVVAMMTVVGCKRQGSRPVDAAFSLVEAMMSVCLLGIMFLSIFAGLSSGFSVVQTDRENLRATQILEEKMEVIRLFNWDQVANLPGYIPTSFTEQLYPPAGTNGSGGGFYYTGTVTVTNAPISETYSNELRMVQVKLAWTSGGLQHQRQMITFVGQYGLQRYIY